ncbi:MAG TPA: molybdopterin-dependent oxidoreductase [Blastocatellia bacterium]|nr:molybdopterin-dependent oxidoreductase [Blastocatellia bacterium]
MKRREFIILGGIGATSASLLSACGHPEEKLIPALIPDEEFVPGIDYWKASTCGMCPAGCGIIVRTREHKANKIEGNPLHPVNRGALCARGQAGLEVLYNPDRIKGPMKRVGERGEGKWEEISWEEGIKTLADKLREIDPNSATDKAHFFTTEPGSVTAHVAGRFMQAYRQLLFAWPPNAGLELEGSIDLPGFVKLGEAIPDISNTTYLVSFAARFLETWKSPVMFSQAYGEFRSTRAKSRGRFIHVEPRLSLTAANADEWIPAAPGSEALVALAMVQVIIREGLSKVPVSDHSRQMLDEFSPETNASMTGVPAERIIRVAREFAKAERPLAIGDLRSPAGYAVHLLNAIVENLNKPGGILLVEGERESYSPFKVPGNGLILPGESDDKNQKPNSLSVPLIERFAQLAEQPPRMMMIHGYNPLLGRGRRDGFPGFPFIVTFSSFMDEASEAADLILPDHSYLERWDVQTSYGPDGRRVASLTQPVLEPQHNTRQTADVLLAVARELGGDVSAALPFESAKELIEKGVSDLVKFVGGESADAWTELGEKGVVTGASPVAVTSAGEQGPSLDLRLELVRQSSSQVATSAEYPLKVIVYEHAAFGEGAAANLPSLQELPDPLTSVLWGSWVEINPSTAAAMSITDGDLVEVATAAGSVRAPALLYPGIRPDCIALPTGQGHSSYGRYARGRGVDPDDLLQGGHQNIEPSRLTKVGGKAPLIRFGTELMEHMESKR